MYVNELPLTPSLLEKCGFAYQGDITGKYKRDNLTISVSPDMEAFALSGVKIHFLHQLQNLFYALTGNELEVTL